MAEEDEELLWDDEDVEQEEDAEQDAGEHVQDEEPGATADQEPHAQEDQPDAAKPVENKQAAVEEDKPAAKSQEPASASQAEEPKRRFPPARVKPADSGAQPALDKALGQSDSKQPKTGAQANQAGAPLKQQDKAKPVQPQQGRQGQGTGRSGRNIKYFVLRSFNEENIQIALQKSGWATTRHNEQKLDEAYSKADEVRLIFSVNGTDHFLGYAMMKTPIGEYPHGQIMWSNGKPFGREFAIEWRIYNPLPFGKVNHLSNPLNDNKPVKMSRDGTELPQDVGDQLVNLMEQQARMDGAPPPPRPLGMGRGRGRGGDMGPGGRQQDMMGRGVGAGGMHGGGHMGGMMGIGPMGMGGKPNQMMMMDALMGNGMGMHQGNGMSMHHGNGMRGGMVGGGMAMGAMGGGGMGMGPGGLGRGPANQQGMGGMHGNQPQRERSRSPITRREGGAWGSRDNGPGMLRRDTPPHMHGSSGMPQMVRDRERTRDQFEGVPNGPNGTASGMARLQNMTYEEYLEQYRKVQQHMEGIKEAQQQHQVGRMGGQMPGGLMMGGMQGVNVGMGQGMGASMADQMQLQQQKAQLEQQQKLQQQQQQQQQMQLQQQMQQQQQMMATMQAMGMGIPPGMAAGGAMGMPGAMGMGMGGMPGMGMMGMMGGMNPMLAGAGGGGMMMPGGMAGNQGFPMGQNMMMGTGAAGSVMASGGLGQNKPFSEDEYIAYTQAHFQSQGKQPPDTEYIRQHYRQQKQSLDMSGGQM